MSNAAITHERLVNPAPEEAAGLSELRSALGKLIEAGSPASLIGPDGQSVPLPDSAFRALAVAVEAMSRGQTVTLIPQGRSLTTQQAAEILHVSRPHLIKLLARPTVRRPTPLREILEEVILKCNYQIEEGAVTITIPDQLPAVNVDGEKMREAITALFANALFFNDRPKGERTIAIDCNVDPDGYRLCVRDNGIGIDPRYTDQIFEPGLKLDKSRGGGPGYGLYLARRIIESHGGAITVEPAPDHAAPAELPFEGVRGRDRVRPDRAAPGPTPDGRSPFPVRRQQLAPALERLPQRRLAAATEYPDDNLIQHNPVSGHKRGDILGSPAPDLRRPRRRSPGRNAPVLLVENDRQRCAR